MIELFSGSGSVAAVFRKNGWIAYTFDNASKRIPRINGGCGNDEDLYHKECDINDLSKNKLGAFSGLSRIRPFFQGPQHTISNIAQNKTHLRLRESQFRS